MSTFLLKPLAPFRLDLTTWVLRRVEINQTDRWDGKDWRRVLVLDGAPIAVHVEQTAPPARPQLTVTTHGGRLTPTRRTHLINHLNRMLGLQVDLKPFLRLATRDKRLATLVKPFAGFKPPRLGSAFETLLNGIACQQISMTAGMHLLNRLCAAYGPAVGDQHAFPRPDDLVHASPSDLRPLGFSMRKAATILNIAHAIVDGQLNLEALADQDELAAMQRLLQLKGIGRWTAQYILLRGLGRLNSFPIDDIGAQNKMQHWLGLPDRPSAAQMADLLAPWQPYQGLLYFYLLLNDQRGRGLLGESG